MTLTSLRIVYPAILSLLATGTAAIVGLSLVVRDEPPSTEAAWQIHRTACLKLPEEIYRKDRARAVRGLVRDEAGKPVSGGLVRCIRMDLLLERAKAGLPTPALWSGLVEAETLTSPDGHYEFPYLAEGSRMICASAPGLAPASLGPVVVQDGAGARVDFSLERAQSLRIRFGSSRLGPKTIYLVPHRWWPELASRDLVEGETEVEFAMLGGAFSKGLVLEVDRDKPAAWSPIGNFEVGTGGPLVISLDAPRPSMTIPEANAIAPWSDHATEANRLFFGMVSPIALFASVGVSTGPNATPDGMGRGVLRGNARGAHLPVLIDTPAGGSWLGWTSEAAEYEVVGLPAGLARVRSLNPFGQITFARGAMVAASGVTEMASWVGNSIDFTEARSREIMGTVRTEDDRPVEGAEIFVQDARDFRRFLKRVVTDRDGFYHVSDVPGDSEYLAFSLPPGDDKAMKRINFPQVDLTRRETWLDLPISPHRATGRLPGGRPGGRASLIRKGSEPEDQLVWTTTADKDGRFEISNIPHARYVIRTTWEDGSSGEESLPFEILTDPVAIVRWPEPSSPGTP